MWSADLNRKLLILASEFEVVAFQIIFHFGIFLNVRFAVGSIVRVDELVCLLCRSVELASLSANLDARLLEIG